METILRDLAEREKFTGKASIEILGSGLKDGSNFHGNLLRARISENGRTLSVIIKKEVPCEEINSSQKFSNEIHFYKTIHPQLKAFGDVPKVPRCYFKRKGIKDAGHQLFIDFKRSVTPLVVIRRDYLRRGIPAALLVYRRYLWDGKLAQGAIIMLEDVSVEGYEPTRSGTELSEAEVDLVLRELEKLHDSSRKMKAQNTELLDKLVEQLEEGFCAGAPYEGVLAQCFKNAVSAAEKYLPENYKEKLSRFDYSKAKDWATKRNGPDLVLTHGDSWYSNFLFKYQGDTPTSVVILDWQMCRMGSPLLDVSELLFSSTSGTTCPSAPECAFGFTMAITILPFSLGQADPAWVLTPEKLVFSDDTVALKRISGIVKAAVDKGIV